MKKCLYLNILTTNNTKSSLQNRPNSLIITKDNKKPYNKIPQFSSIKYPKILILTQINQNPSTSNLTQANKNQSSANQLRKRCIYKVTIIKIT